MSSVRNFHDGLRMPEQFLLLIDSDAPANLLRLKIKLIFMLNMFVRIDDELNGELPSVVV